MRLAILSDIHGNPIALDAVLDDVAQLGGVDGYWFLGDLVAIGYDPAGVLMRLAALPNAHFVQGNTDRYVVTGDRPYPSLREAETDSTLLPRLVEVAHSFAWTQGYVSGSGWFDWLAALPLEERTNLPDGTRMLAVHVAPGMNDGPGVHPQLSDADLEQLVSDASADLVCVGHTHRPLDRQVNGVRVINTGSVSNPHLTVADMRASYVVLDAGAEGYALQHRRVRYDYARVIAAVEASHHPAGAYINRHFVPRREPLLFSST